MLRGFRVSGWGGGGGGGGSCDFGPIQARVQEFKDGFTFGGEPYKSCSAGSSSAGIQVSLFGVTRYESP